LEKTSEVIDSNINPNTPTPLGAELVLWLFSGWEWRPGAWGGTRTWRL